MLRAASWGAARAPTTTLSHAGPIASRSLSFTRPLSGTRPPSPPSFSSAYALPSHVKIVEVGPRDGLQNEKKMIPTSTKVELVRRLVRAGVSYIEATSFVSGKAVPQMSDASDVMNQIRAGEPDGGPFGGVPGVHYSALTPNIKGFESAMAAGVAEVAIFAAASDAFSAKNINCTVLESLERFRPVADGARAAGVRLRGYVSCVVGCPYSGPVDPEAVGFVAQSLMELGCAEVSLGDTIGVGTPRSVREMLNVVKAHVPVHSLAVHFHATYGCALANILVALEEGVTVVDSAVGGLGGCPYAAGASGNVATEDVVYMLHGLGITTGVDLDALALTGDWICRELGRPNASHAGVARTAALQSAAVAATAAGSGAAPPGLSSISLCWPTPPFHVPTPAAHHVTVTRVTAAEAAAAGVAAQAAADERALRGEE